MVYYIFQSRGQSNVHGFFFAGQYCREEEKRDRISMNIVLIGYRCSGKTSVGQTLAEALNRDFMDTDELIEGKVGRSIEAIIARDGWDCFRDMEKEIIEEVSGRDHLVIATGGGVVLDRENIRRLRGKGLLIWLKGSAAILKERMERQQREGTSRPSLTGKGPLEEIEQVLKIRTPLYEKATDLTVNGDALSVTDVAAAILDRLPENI